MLAPLRTYVQALVERYAHQLPVGEYILQMSLVGGIAGVTDTLSFNVHTGAVYQRAGPAPAAGRFGSV